VLIALASVVALSVYIGPSRRLLPAEREVIRAASPSEVAQAVEQAGVRNATLIVLDSRARASMVVDLYAFIDTAKTPSKGPYTDSSLVGGMLMQGVARRAYVCPPDKEWAAVSEEVSKRFDQWQVGLARRMRMYGPPVEFSAPEDLRIPNEPYMVLFNMEYAGSYDAAWVQQLTTSPNARLVILYDRSAAK
jgi:hypothetical protein